MLVGYSSLHTEAEVRARDFLLCFRRPDVHAYLRHTRKPGLTSRQDKMIHHDQISGRFILLASRI